MLLVQILPVGWTGMGFGTQSPYGAQGNLQVEHVKYIPLTISYHLFFSVSLKF